MNILRKLLPSYTEATKKSPRRTDHLVADFEYSRDELGRPIDPYLTEGRTAKSFVPNLNC
jgi:hypothetical protein